MLMVPKHGMSGHLFQPSTKLKAWKEGESKWKCTELLRSAVCCLLGWTGKDGRWRIVAVGHSMQHGLVFFGLKECQPPDHSVHNPLCLVVRVTVLLPACNQRCCCKNQAEVVGLSWEAEWQVRDAMWAKAAAFSLRWPKYWRTTQNNGAADLPRWRL